MHIERHGDERLCQLVITGELDIYQAQPLKEALLEALGASAELELDLGGVTELDSTGLQLLYLAKREASATGKALRLVAHSEATRQVLDLYGLVAFFGDSVLIPAARSVCPTPASEAQPA